MRDLLSGKKCHQSCSCIARNPVTKRILFATMRVPFWKRRSAMTSEFPADPPKKRNCHLPKGMKQVVYENKIHCVTKDNP
jgi:hypothetical protein